MKTQRYKYQLLLIGLMFLLASLIGVLKLVEGAWIPWFAVIFKPKERQGEYGTRIVQALAELDQLKKELRKLNGRNNFEFLIERCALDIKFNEIDEAIGDARRISDLLFSLDVQPRASIMDILTLLHEAWEIQAVRGAV